MMADYNEYKFEEELCQHLESNGWLYSRADKGFDRGRALWPEDVFGWLGDTQPSSLAKVVKPAATDAEQDKQRSQLLDALTQKLDTPMESGGGTLNVLRYGFKHLNSGLLKMCQFKPAYTHNEVDNANYAKNRLRVVRQVHFSADNSKSVDLVLFVNGLPVATLELKTDNTQAIEDAIKQYKNPANHRTPKNPDTGRTQPLFAFGQRALVHFALSNEEAWMTTKLAGKETHFLPFNRGNDGGALDPANPPNPNGSATSYVWERILQRDSWLRILGDFIHLSTEDSRDPITGAVTRRTNLLFPRFHQWEAVNALLDAAALEGPGQRYLVQHSAGSGKTNSIAWTAHRLARLVVNDKKVFDSVIVITDRTVLDDQLQEAIRSINNRDDIVVTIDAETIRKEGKKSKSDLLAAALKNGKLIVVVTLQTFPVIAEQMKTSKALAGKRFAVIADEAHSSQTGTASQKLRAALSPQDLADLEDGGEYSVEDELIAEMESRAEAPNVSYFAFTATPKAKTIEMFGRPPASDPDGNPEPFHIYTMKQAIEEEFILDVLQGYQTYDTAFEIAKRSSEGGDDELVDKSDATTKLMRWVKLHPTNISQKVQIIVEHFHGNVAHLLDGHAKAMVVTDSRKAAVRYKQAMDKYIHAQGYDSGEHPMGTLVAFSGTVEDEGLEYTEASMNPGAGSLRKAFAKPEYRVMLVANKFQTGFDQPLLCAMYVDKRLDGVTAVQTLSRLNRTYRNSAKGIVKDTTMVLDFVNEPETIRNAFEPYYKNAFLETATDPNLVHQIAAKLDQSGLYSESELDAYVDAWMNRKGHNALEGVIAPVASRFNRAYADAVLQGDKAEQARLETVRKDVGTFVRVYSFMSQIINYNDTDLEKRLIFFKMLERRISQRPDSDDAVDLTAVTLTKIEQRDTGKTDIKLDGQSGLKGATGAGSAVQRDPKMVALQEVIDRLNEIFGDLFSETQQESWLEALVARLLENASIVQQAKANPADRFMESADFKQAVIEAMLDNQEAFEHFSKLFVEGGASVDNAVRVIGDFFHRTISGEFGIDVEVETQNEPASDSAS